MTSGRKKCKDVVVCKTVEYHNDCTLDEDAKPHLPVTRSEILDSVTMVRTLEDSKKIVNHLLQCHQIVAIDVKGRDLGKRNGKISLIAVGTCNGQCLLFDIHTNCQLVLKGRLKHMLECKGLIKVMHDGCLIRSALQQCYGVKIRSIFDTQVAHAVIEGHRSGKNPRCIPYETPLFISYTYGRCVLTPADHALEKMYLENCNFWDTRPLPCKQKEYAARGVLALLPEAYNNMNRRLQGPLRITFRTLCQGKSIELADCNSMSGQGSTSSLKAGCSKLRRKRSLSPGSPCRSFSSSGSSIVSDCNSWSAHRCDSGSPLSPLRKKVKKVGKFKVSPRKSRSASSCGSNKVRVVARKPPSTSVNCTCVSCTNNVLAACKTSKRSPGCKASKKSSVCSTPSLLSACTSASKTSSCKSGSGTSICRSPCRSFNWRNPTCRSLNRLYKYRSPSRTSRTSSCGAKKKHCPTACKILGRTSSCKTKKKHACRTFACGAKKKTSCTAAIDNSNCVKTVARRKTVLRTCAPKKKRCARKCKSGSDICINRKRCKPAVVLCKKKRRSCAPIACAQAVKPRSALVHCKKKRRSCAPIACAQAVKPKFCVKACRKACPKKKERACPQKILPCKTMTGTKRCVKAMKNRKKNCTPNPCAPNSQSSICLIRSIGKNDCSNGIYTNLVRRGWNTVMAMEVDDDENMEIDDDEEPDFADEMLPPAAKRKRG